MHIKYFILSIFFSLSLVGNAQTKLNRGNVAGRETPFTKDTTKTKTAKSLEKTATIDMYHQYNTEQDTIVVDTTLSIKKDYKFNYLQNDNFGLMPFANIGQTYNKLTYNTSTRTTLPLFGARARHFNYLETEAIKYYEVPTPWTRLTYKTAFEQGQLLDAFFTVNLSKQFNFAIAYKGLRSLGNYQNALTSSGNFRFVTSYKSKDESYSAKGHIVMQDLLNQENGGLKAEDIENFESGDEEFLDRSIFDPNFDNAENILVGKRFFLNHAFNIIKSGDTIAKNKLAIENTIAYEDKYYQFYQTTSITSFFGTAFAGNITDKVTLENFYTQLGLNYENKRLGHLKFHLSYTNLNYGYNGVVLFQNEQIPNRIKTNFLGVNAQYSKTIKKTAIAASGALNLSDRFKGSYLDVNVNYHITDDLNLNGGINLSSKLPNYNYLLYQSDYINYNWYNLGVYKNENKQQIRLNITSKKFLELDADITNINNYTFFNLESTVDANKIIKPKQYNKHLQYLRLKIKKEFKLGHFALDNTIMYQNIVSDDNVLNVPSIIARNTLYYTNQLFNKAMTLQTGLTCNYFTKYKMNGYDPLLAEFYTQNETELGGFPRLDFFINAKVRQTRLFFKAEHFNSSFTGYNYFSAPNHPYRDFTIRFGLVWDFFL